MHQPGGKSRNVILLAALAAMPASAFGFDTSVAPSLQYFESTYESQFNRSADIFMAGYGFVWIPPTGRASTGNSSVGYDPRDRFDLGTWQDKTLYGTETGLRKFAAHYERTGGSVMVDLIWNHNGYQYDDTAGFMQTGGYPGMVLQNPDGGTDPFGVPGTNGDFHSPYASGNDSRFNNLIDIDHASNFQLIRNPVQAGNPQNIPAGTTSWFGYTANVPNANNARFYPDTSLSPIMVFNPGTGQTNIPIYPFNTANPLAGDAVPENALGYLMRNARWLVQDVGVEGFRLDIPWHYPQWVLNYFDQAVYRASTRTNLDGSQYNAFSYMEAGDGAQSTLLANFVKKNINPNDPGKVGSNYDALDFNFMRQAKNNLSNNGFQNDWRNLIYTSLDYADDGLNNGTAGIKFVQSHDDTSPALNNVAHAYMLMMPGQANVFFNAWQHGDNRGFPRDGREDALGGYYGNTLTKILAARNSNGRGNYHERWVEKETYIFERGNSALIGLSNRTDAGYDQRRVDVDFAWGTTLVELTGNSTQFTDIPDLITVDNDFFQGPSKATIRVPRNNGGDRGYVIYGLASPKSTAGVTITQSGNPVGILVGGTPTNTKFSNGGTILTDRYVVTGNTFTLGLDTQAVTLTGRRLESSSLVTRSIRDKDADGDAALFKFDGGLNLNGQNPYNTISGVDFDTGDFLTGFEQFVTLNQNGYAATDGNGHYAQIIDATQLSEGEHYITIRAFRHRADGGPAVFQDFKKVIYVDRLAPVSAVSSLDSVNAAGSGDRDILVESTDLTGDSVHVFTNLPATTSDATILSMAQAGQGKADKVDLNLFKLFQGGLPEGNNVVTVVTYEVTGRSNVQRFVGKLITDGQGVGFGDLDHNSTINSTDISQLGTVLASNNSQFNPSADITGDGLVDNNDLTNLRTTMLTADNTTQGSYQALYNSRINVNSQWNQNANGNWTTMNNWSTVAPNSNAAVANFTSAIAAPKTITVDSPQTVSAINFDNSNKYTIAGSSTLTINSATTGTVTVTSGSHDITAPLVLSKPTTFTINGSGNKLKLTNLQNTSNAITKSGAGILQVNKIQTTGAVTVNSGILELTANGTASGILSAGNISVAGKIELHDNDMVSNYGGTSNYANIVNAVKSGLTILGGTGTSGIGSAEVDNQTIQGTMLAVVDDGDANINGAITAVSGFNIPSPTTSTLVKFTWFGDSNLDGLVDGSDYALLDSGFTSGGALGGWVFGDFDYSGIVDGSDYALIDTGFISQSGVLPEPSILSLLGLGAISLIRRRK